MFFRFRFDVGLISYGDICPTLIANDNGGVNDLSHGVLYMNESKKEIKKILVKNTTKDGAVEIKNGTEVRIRKLTTRECFRLQGFPDEYFERAASVNSDSQLYKQAGNSVTVNVIYEIAKRLKMEDEQ